MMTVIVQYLFVGLFIASLMMFAIQCLTFQSRYPKTKDICADPKETVILFFLVLIFWPFVMLGLIAGNDI